MGHEDSVDATIQQLEDYIGWRWRRLITATKNKIDSTRINRTNITRKQKWEEKQLSGHLKQLTCDISHEKTWLWLKRRNLKRETESLLIVAQNNTIRTIYIKARIEKMQQNSKCRLCGEREETINHILSKCCKLAQNKYKTWHDWLNKVIHLELCKKLKFDHTNRWYMHNPESVLENEMHKLLWDFQIQADHLLSVKWPDLIIINKKKKTWRNVDFAVPADHRVKWTENEKKDKYLDLARELKWKWWWYQF